MARSKVVLPPDSTGQAMGVTTYSNGAETVAAPETVLVSTTGTPITPTTPSDTQPVSGTFWQATQPVSGTVTVQDGGGAISIDDNGSTVSIDDGGGSVTIDGTVGVSGTVTVDSELTTADLDTGAGTDTRAVVGLVYGGSGGGTLVSATNPLPIGDNGGSITVDGTFWQATQPVSGTVTANAGSGTMAVSAAALPLPTGASTLAEQQTQTTSLQLLDDTILTDDAAFTPATSKVSMVGAEYDDTSPDSVDEGDAGALRMSANRTLYTQLRDAAGNERGANITAANALKVDNSGVTQPVSGTVTASQGGAPWSDNVTQLGGTAIDTNSGTKSAGTQRVVLATDQPQLTNALKVDGSAVTQPVSGTFWQATQPVSGTVTANAGSGTMAVSLAAGATAPAKAEDVASADADVGIPAMAVRKATPANTSGTDGDYEMLQMSAGRLWASVTVDTALPAGTAAIGKLAANDGVDVGDVTINNASGGSAVNVQDGGNSLTVDNGGTFAVQAAQSGTWTVQPGNTANTTAWKVDASSVAVPITDNSGSLTVDNGGTFAVQDSEKVADNAGFTDGTTKVLPAGFIFDEVAGTALTENDAAAARIDSKRAQVGVLEDATTRGQRAAVSAGGALKVDNSAVTQPVSGTVTASNAAGDVAHDGVDSGNPIKIGGKAKIGGEPTAVSTDGDRVNAWFDGLGRLVVAPFHPEELTPVTATLTSASDTSLIAAPGASLSLYICSLLVTNTSATLTRVDFKDGSGGTTRVTGAAAASGGGWMWHPMRPWKLTANTALFWALSGAVTDVRVTVEYFTAA